jgi:hypothetical protein
MEALADDLEKLDNIGKALYVATDELTDAEEAWDALFDAIAEDLKDAMEEAGRKGDPAEHVVTSVCRRQHRAEYQRLRRAKRDLERLQSLSQVRRQVASGRQSELAALRDESRGPQPAWSGAA